jgi:hypothetical protein
MRITHKYLTEGDWLGRCYHLQLGISAQPNYCGVCCWYAKCDPLARNRALHKPSVKLCKVMQVVENKGHVSVDLLPQ